MFSITKQKLILIVGIVFITAFTVTWYAYRHFGSRVIPLAGSKHAYVTVADLPSLTSTSTDQIRQMLEEAFIQDRLVVVSTQPIARTKGSLVFAAPSLSPSVADIGNCGLQSNPYCGWYRVDDTGRHLVSFGSKLAGDSIVERFIDADHVQIRNEWSLYNFDSIEHKQLNLQNGELLPLLSIEIDQDDAGASMNVTGSGIVLSLSITGESKTSQLLPQRVDVKDQSGAVVFTLPYVQIGEMQTALQGDEKRMLKPVAVKPQEDDVIAKTIHLDLYGIPYIFDLSKRTLIKQ